MASDRQRTSLRALYRADVDRAARVEARMNAAAMKAITWIHPVLALLLAPFLLGVINRTKAFFAGRRGSPLLQAYYDMWKLVHKGAVYSRTTTWVFRAGPTVGLAAVIAALLLLPFGRLAAPIRFEGDLILFAGLLALMR